jgi:hypothetical protein
MRRDTGVSYHFFFWRFASNNPIWNLILLEVYLLPLGSIFLNFEIPNSILAPFSFIEIRLRTFLRYRTPKTRNDLFHRLPSSSISSNVLTAHLSILLCSQSHMPATDEGWDHLTTWERYSPTKQDNFQQGCSKVTSTLWWWVKIDSNVILVKTTGLIRMPTVF